MNSGSGGGVGRQLVLLEGVVGGESYLFEEAGELGAVACGVL